MYDLLYPDPAWRFKNWSMDELVSRGERWARKNGRSPYPVMTIDDLCKMPLGDLGNRNSIMLMWATYPKMEDALRAMKAWGYEFKTFAFTWVKLNPSGIGWHFGLGYHTRQNPEPVLLGTRGKGLKRFCNKVPNLVVYPRGSHSRKPPVVRQRIIDLYGPEISRIELFARQTSPGFDAWGNEVDCQIAAVNDLLDDYVVPPASAIVDDDEYKGLPVDDTIQEYFDAGEQIRLAL